MFAFDGELEVTVVTIKGGENLFSFVFFRNEDAIVHISSIQYNMVAERGW